MCLAEIPAFRKYEPVPLINGSKDVALPRNELIVVINSTPVDPVVMPDAGLRISNGRLCACISVATDVCIDTRLQLSGSDLLAIVASLNIV